MTMLNERSARFLMCRPEHFAVSYTINPWMNPKRWARDAGAHAAAEREWAALHRKLVELGAAVELVPPAAGLPDLVFTANAAVVLDRQALLARFRHPQRQREEGHFEAAFRSLQARGLIDGVTKLPAGLVLEGAGDCVWDERRNLFWMGYGPRSDAAAAHAVADMFAREVVALELADERFYHMDTALAPLPGGEVMDVFTPGSHGSTFGGNPLAAAVGLEALHVIRDEGLVEKSRVLGAHMLERLRAIASPALKDVRGRGLWVGAEINPAIAGAREACERLLAKGVLSKETHQTVVRLAPPLVIARADLDWALDRFEEVLRELDGTRRARAA